MGYSKTTYEENRLECNMLEKSLNKFKKEFQATINELQGKYVALVDGNGHGSYFASGAELGKIWLELKFLHASHKAINELVRTSSICKPHLFWKNWIQGRGTH